MPSSHFRPGQERQLPDYEKFEELMTFWSSIPQGIHRAWREALPSASRLPQGKRSLIEIQHRVSEARYYENRDYEDLSFKMQTIVAGLPVQKGDVEGTFPWSFGCLLGLKGPELGTNVVTDLWAEETENTWEKHYAPLAASLQMDQIGSCVTEILQKLSMDLNDGQGPAIRKRVGVLYEQFMAYRMQESCRAWREKLTDDFPEVLEPCGCKRE